MTGFDPVRSSSNLGTPESVMAVGLEAAILNELGRYRQLDSITRADGTIRLLSRDCKPLFGHGLPDTFWRSSTPSRQFSGHGVIGSMLGFHPLGAGSNPAVRSIYI